MFLMIYLVIGKIFVHKYLRSLKIGEHFFSGVLLIRVLIVTTLCLQLSTYVVVPTGAEFLDIPYI